MISKIFNVFKSNGFYRADVDTNSKDGKSINVVQRAHPFDANLIGSKKTNGKHSLFLDLDIQHIYKESSSGNGHLMINLDLSFDEMLEILTVLNKYGVIQYGFINGTKGRRQSFLRMPGIKKETNDDNWFYNENYPTKGNNNE